jgi:hypothetical protein
MDIIFPLLRMGLFQVRPKQPVRCVFEANGTAIAIAPPVAANCSCPAGPCIVALCEV